MKKTVSSLFLSFCLCSSALLSCAAAPSDAGVRPPAVAGQFYPDDPKKLEAAVKGYLADALPARGERPIGLVAPHAGYVYSGQIAADAYRQAAAFTYDVIVILGTNHTTRGFDQVSVYQGGGYRTPLGVAEIDRDLAQALLEADRSITFRPEVHEREHSVEVQVPFVQVVFPGIPIVSAVVGEPDLGLTERFGRVLAQVLGDRQALIVSSSDFSHYPRYEDAVAADHRVLAAIASLDPVAVSETIIAQMRQRRPNLSTCACGEGPILAAMAAASARGATRGIVISYANSGDAVFGEPSKVVGYGAVAFTAGPGGPDTQALEKAPPATGPVVLTEADRKYLLSLARQTIERYLVTGTVPFARLSSPALQRKQGAFVTLKKHGQLRGCIGHMAEDTPLGLTVARMALQAAFRDTRFQPVRPVELPALEVEISVLTPLARVSGPEAIQVGRDGVVIEKAGHRAVFLPQVAVEQGWSRDQMLGRLCLKAGLAMDCWQRDTEFFTFQAIVFGEGEKGE